jgi:hypothetical protein
MADAAQTPASAKPTGEAAFNKLKKEIAERNESAHKEARKLRDVRDRQKAAERRARDLL